MAKLCLGRWVCRARRQRKQSGNKIQHSRKTGERKRDHKGIRGGQAIDRAHVPGVSGPSHAKNFDWIGECVASPSAHHGERRSIGSENSGYQGAGHPERTLQPAKSSSRRGHRETCQGEAGHRGKGASEESEPVLRREKTGAGHTDTRKCLESAGGGTGRPEPVTLKPDLRTKGRPS